MKQTKLSIPDLIKITPNRFSDERGYFCEIFKDRWFRENVADVDFVQENESLSVTAGVVRGLHFQIEPFAQDKLVRCVAGAIFDVVVDLRSNSASFGKWDSTVLSAATGDQLWIPKGFAHGFCTLAADTIVIYKVTASYSPAHDKGISWNDPDIGIEWPDIADRDSMSDKDRKQPLLRDIPDYFKGDS